MIGIEKKLRQGGVPATIKTTTIGEQMLVHVNREAVRLISGGE